MTREQVIAVWGEPVVKRSAGAWTYLFFRNGCEVSCGTFDVVFLQDGQVVDAIVRGEGHIYAGVSSSPPGRVAEPTPGRAGFKGSSILDMPGQKDVEEVGGLLVSKQTLPLSPFPQRSFAAPK